MAQFSKKYGKWQARIRWYDQLGKRHSTSKNGFKTKAEAQKWAIEAQGNLYKGIKLDENVSLANYYDRWFEEYKKPKLSQPSTDWYYNVGKRIHKYFGNTKLNELNRSTYQTFINKYAENHSPASVRKTNNIIRQCIKSAILDDYIIKDFTQGVTLSGNKNLEVHVDYLNIKEIKALLKEAKHVNTNRLYTSRYMIVTAIYTGMRLGEIQALTWNDIDWLHHTITINKSWNARAKKFKPTKTKSSNRTIKVNQDLLNCLMQLRKRSNSNMVFMCWDRTVPTTDAVNHCLHKMLKDLGINRKNFHFHSLRHSQVALLLANGIDIYAISKRLGHSNVATTSQIYAYLIDEYKDKLDTQIINALEKLNS